MLKIVKSIWILALSLVLFAVGLAVSEGEWLARITDKFEKFLPFWINVL